MTPMHLGESLDFELKMVAENEIQESVSLYSMTITNNDVTQGSGFGAGVSLAYREQPPRIFNTIIWGNGGNSLEENLLVRMDSEFSLQSEIAPLEMNPAEFMSNLIIGGIDALLDEQELRELMIFSDDPMFLAPAQGDYRLSAHSPAIDQGNNGFGSGYSDVGGNTRIQNGKIDIGAFEFQPNIVSLSGGENTNVTFGKTLEEITSLLPQKLTAELPSGETVDLPVSWELENDPYDPTSLKSLNVQGVLDLPDHITNTNDISVSLTVTIEDDYLISYGVEREVGSGAHYYIQGSNSSIIMPTDLPEATRIKVEQVNPDNISHMDDYVVAGDIYEVTVVYPDGTSEPLTHGDFILNLHYFSGLDPELVEIYYYDEGTNKWVLKGGQVDKSEQFITLEVSHFSTYGVFQKRQEQTPVEKEEDNEGPILGTSPSSGKVGKDSTNEKNHEVKDGEALPSTATNSYNWLLVGLLMLLIGSSIFFWNRKKQSLMGVH
ncbi:LPXTG cell wall anchor domain-containing protein [Bacillus tamaricis]|uniref:LPXTG cell wall anchor domain-containing protein n=2 Tax=Evansella tamaricis TaxID=2069301 RepID=A0ABS6JGH4_9BACI|nr:LPXTG cell wall anchor domain-containing protein [Evansella tamaricis]